MSSVSRGILRVGWGFAALGLLFAFSPAGSERPAEPFATPQVRLEAAWLVADEQAGGMRLAQGPRPPGASERLYTARFRHDGDRTVGGLQITVAIPAGMRYVADSAVGPGAELSFSADHGRSFAPPAEVVLAAEDADPADPQPAVRRATADEYTHIRWRLAGEFLPGTAGLVSFRARPVEIELQPEAKPEPEPDAAAVEDTR